jgi:energy-converting hydrogenase B subunit D
MTMLIAIALTLVGLTGTAVVVANVPERQAVTLSFYGLTLTVLFVVLQAPDVALSQLGIGAAIVPLMVMLAIRTITTRHAPKSRSSGNRR